MTTYDDIVVADGPVLYLPLNDTSGTTATATVGSNGTYVGSPTLNQSGPDATEIPKSISTDGTDDRVDVSGATLGLNQAQSIEFWADYGADITTSDPGTSAGVFCGPTNDNSAIGFGAFTGLLTDELVTVANEEGGSGDRTGWTQSGGTIPNGWHHYVLTFSGTQDGWILYIDGEDVTGTTWGFTKSSNSGGARGLSSIDRISHHPVYAAASRYEAWAGISAFSVYDYELTATQVAQHYSIAPPAFKSLASNQAVDGGATLVVPLDDFGGTKIHFVDSTSQGSSSGSPTFRVSGPNDGVPFGISTDGTDDYIEVGSLSPGANSPHSIEFWLDSPVTIDSAMAFKRVLGSTTGDEWTVTFGAVTGSFADEVITVVDSKSGASRLSTWRGSLSISTGWHHYVFAFDGTQDGWTLYIDGEDATGTTWGATRDSNNSGALGIGTDTYRLAVYSPSSQYAALDGLSAFHLYDSELSAKEVYKRYATQADQWDTSNAPRSY